jgi:hypothetical protein
MNRAKRVAKAADKRDQTQVQATLGFGLPRQHSHHHDLVERRHRYYREQVAAPSTPEPARQQGARECARRRRQMERARGSAVAA